MNSIDSTMQFLGNCVGKPMFSGSKSQLDNLPLITKSLSITNARSLQTNWSLDTHGFELHNSPVARRNFQRNGDRQSYLREIENLVADITGASLTVAMGNGVIRRSERSDGYLKDGTTVPGRFVHCDFSEGPGGSDYWVDMMLAMDQARVRKTKRYAIYNVWRCLSAPPQDSVLALCDAQSVHASDIVRCDQIIDSGDPVVCIENSVFRYNSDQRYYYFADMLVDEVLVFKGFESDQGKAGGIAHAAVDMPGGDGGLLTPRESIDERVIAFF